MPCYLILPIDGWSKFSRYCAEIRCSSYLGALRTPDVSVLSNRLAKRQLKYASIYAHGYSELISTHAAMNE